MLEQLGTWHAAPAPHASRAVPVPFTADRLPPGASPDVVRLPGRWAGGVPATQAGRGGAPARRALLAVPGLVSRALALEAEGVGALPGIVPQGGAVVAGAGASGVGAVAGQVPCLPALEASAACVVKLGVKVAAPEEGGRGVSGL